MGLLVPDGAPNVGSLLVQGQPAQVFSQLGNLDLQAAIPLTMRRHRPGDARRVDLLRLLVHG